MMIMMLMLLMIILARIIHFIISYREVKKDLQETSIGDIVMHVRCPSLQCNGSCGSLQIVSVLAETEAMIMIMMLMLLMIILARIIHIIIGYREVKKNEER